MFTLESFAASTFQAVCKILLDRLIGMLNSSYSVITTCFNVHLQHHIKHTSRLIHTICKGMFKNNTKILTLIIVDMTSFLDSCFDSFLSSSSVKPSMYFLISCYKKQENHYALHVKNDQIPETKEGLYLIDNERKIYLSCITQVNVPHKA